MQEGMYNVHVAAHVHVYMYLSLPTTLNPFSYSIAYIMIGRMQCTCTGRDDNTCHVGLNMYYMHSLMNSEYIYSQYMYIAMPAYR